MSENILRVLRTVCFESSNIPLLSFFFSVIGNELLSVYKRILTIIKNIGPLFS